MSRPNPTQHVTAEVPLCVSFEEALLVNPLRAEAWLRMARRQPGALLRHARRSGVGDPLEAGLQDSQQGVPFRHEVVEFLRAERERGRRLVLVHSAPAALVDGAVRAIGFHQTVATEGRAEHATLEDRFGPGGFDFVGGPRSDPKVGTAARRVILVSPGGDRRVAVADGTEVERVLAASRPSARDVMAALRPHQWLKNLLVFVPLIAGQEIGDPGQLLRTVAAFVSFSLIASATYLVNDMLDLEADRSHETKRHRPFASGRLPLSWAPWLIGGLTGVGLAVALGLSTPPLAAILGVYVVITLAYSLRLKGAVLVDVLVLAGLYTLRVLAGSAATGIEPSMWLLAFSMFIFFSLALVKRYAELHALISANGVEDTLRARSYRKVDLNILVAMGCSSGYLSVLVLALYIVSEEASAHYSDSPMIWLLCPLLLYWISRAWIVVARDEMSDDPLVWAVRDQISRWVALGAALVVLLAR